jgi:RNA polymerase sigma-70 factor, ECF subfamily
MSARAPGARIANTRVERPMDPRVEMPKRRTMATADLDALADEDLMALVNEGEARAFEVIFDRHASAAFSLAYRMCGTRAMAEDVVQEAFLSLWRSGARYDRTRGSVRSWVLNVARNRTIDAFRCTGVNDRRGASDDRIAEIAAPELTDTEVVRREDARQVRVALEKLPADQRRVIELAYFGGFTHSQIAEMLELPPGTVKGRMRLGLAKLSGSLGPWVGATRPSPENSNRIAVAQDPYAGPDRAALREEPPRSSLAFDT